MYPSLPEVPFVSAHPRASAVKVLLIVNAVLSGLMMIFHPLTLAFPVPGEDADLSGSDVASIAVHLALFIVAVITVVVYLTTVVFFSLWLYLATKNVSAFGASVRSLSYTPGFAVGSFFIPFANLVIPYRAVKEVWQNSVPVSPNFLGVTSPPAWFITWWIFWLLCGWADQISLRLSFREATPATVEIIVSVVADVLTIVAALFAYVVVNDIDDRQENTAKELKLGKYAQPPAPNLAPQEAIPH